MILEKLSDNSKKLFFDLEMALASIDGHFDDIEKNVIKQHCAEMGIPFDVSAGSGKGVEAITAQISSSMSNQEKKIVYIELLSVALADGVFDEDEMAFVEEIREGLGIPDDVGRKSFELVSKLSEATRAIEKYVEW